MDVLYERATKGISDIKEGKIVHNAKLINKENGQDKEIKTYSTTQLQKTTKDSNGNSVDTYVTTTFAVVNTSDLEKNVSNSSSGTMTIQSYDGNKGDSKWDTTGGIKAYSTVYWNNSTYGSLSFVNMAGQTLTGGWTIYDSSISVNNRTFDAGQQGPGYTFFVSNIQNPIYAPITWSYTVPSNWQAVQNVNGGLSIAGMHTYSLLKGGTSSWNLDFSNYICK